MANIDIKGENIFNYVRDQLSLREFVISQVRSELTNQPGPTYNPFITLPSGKQAFIDPGAPFVFTSGKACTIRMSSGVNLRTENNILLPGEEDLGGSNLAKKYVLEGGTRSIDISRTSTKETFTYEVQKGDTLSSIAKKFNVEDWKVIAQQNNIQDVTKLQIGQQLTIKGGIDSFSGVLSSPRSGIGNQLGTAYGDPFIRANEGDGFGIVPMPGIIDANLRQMSANGAVREAKVNFVCHNRKQLDVLDALYMRPGLPVMLEWGWTPYLSNEGTIETDFPTIPEFFSNNVTKREIHDIIRYRKKEFSGNYDGFLGQVKNFSISARPDGGYDCTTELLGRGGLIEALRGTRNKTKVTPLYIRTNEWADGALSLSSVDPRGELVKEIANKTLVDDLKSSDDLLNILIAIRDVYQQRTISEQIAATYNDVDEDGTTRTYSQASYVENGQLVQGSDRYSNFEPNNAENLFIIQETIATNEEIQDIEDKATNTPNENLYAAGQGRETLLPNNDLYKKDTEEVFKLLQDNGLDFLNKPERVFSYFEYTKTEEDGSQDGLFQTFIRWDYLSSIINLLCLNQERKGNPEIEISFTNELRTEYLEYSLPFIDKKVFPDITIDGIQEKTIVSELVGISYDFNTCIMPHQSFYVDNFGKKDKFEIFKDTKPMLRGVKASKKSIGYVKFNIEFLIETYINNKYERNSSDNEFTFPTVKNNFNLKKYIDDIWEGVNRATGDIYNFKLHTEFEHSYRVRILDFIGQPKSLRSQLYEFSVQGLNTVTRDFGITTSITNEMAAQASIAALNPNDADSLEAVTFARFNRGVKSRFSEDSGNIVGGRGGSAAKLQGDIEKFQATIGELATYKLGMERGFYDLRPLGFAGAGLSTPSKAIALVKEIDSQIISIASRFPLEDENGSPHPKAGLLRQNDEDIINDRTPPLLLDVNIKMDGISGLNILNLFSVRNDHLPIAYDRPDLGFMIFGIEENISAGNDWTTTLRAGLKLLPTENRVIGKNKFIKIPDPTLGELLGLAVKRQGSSVPRGLNLGFLNPVTHEIRITGEFGEERKNSSGLRRHKGIDIGAKTQNVPGDPIIAPFSGIVTEIVEDLENNTPGGTYVRIEFENFYKRSEEFDSNGITSQQDDGWEDGGDPDKVIATFFHLSEIEGRIQKNYIVKAGEIIGLMGGKPGDPGSGNASTGVHLHYQVEVIGSGAESLRGDADEWWDIFSNQQSNTSAIGNLVDPAFLLSTGKAYEDLGFEIGNQFYQPEATGGGIDKVGYVLKRNYSSSTSNSSLSTTSYSSTAAQYSDKRLKTNIIKVGNTEYGISLYEFNYKNTLGLDHTSRFRGMIAQDLLKTNMLKAVILNNNGYYSIDYSQLNINLEKIS